jgi:tRNA-specific 2-thiouridylase
MRVVVAMSGGVDSSVAAGLLQQQGHEVIGMTLRLFDCEGGQNERSCCGLVGVAEARAAAGTLGIPHYVVDGQALFESQVLKHSWNEYAAGRTPNPCVTCNEWLKFGLLFDYARRLDAERIATGHHARIDHAAADGPRLLRGRDENKDQSYFLFSLTVEQLAMSLLPVGQLTKAEVREFANALALPNAQRLESQDACIAQRGDLAEALRLRFGGRARPGEIIDLSGRVLGEHQGVHHFTIGQRKGLGVALGQRTYVVSIDAERARVVVADDPASLAARGLRAINIRWLVDPRTLGDEFEGQIKIRYRTPSATGRVRWLVQSGEAEVYYATPQRAVTPGQAVVFYHGDRVLGGGWIRSSIPLVACAG